VESSPSHVSVQGGMGKIFGHGVHVIIGKCRVLPVGALLEGELHLIMNAIVS
jgi:hypothetical protein